MATRDRDDVGTSTVEIAFNVRAFVSTGTSNSLPSNTAMITMSIFWILVLGLFGLNAGEPNEREDEHENVEF